MPSRYHQITTADLSALLDCRAALADLVHVLDSVPDGGLTSPELRDGYQDWLDGTMAHAHAALDQASRSLSTAPLSERAVGGAVASESLTPSPRPDRPTGSAGPVARGAPPDRHDCVPTLSPNVVPIKGSIS